MPNSTATRLADIENDGCTIIENVISAELMTRIRTELGPYCQGEYLGRNNFEGIYAERVCALLAEAPSVAGINEHSITLELIDQLLPKNFLLSAAPSILVHPAETPQPFHYDDGFAGLPVCKPRPRFGVSTIWAFDDFDEINGATEVIPGRHRWAEDREPKEAEAIKVFMPAGSVVVLNGALIHRGEANNSNKDRLAITPQYCNPGLRQIETRVLSLPPSIAGNYSERIKIRWAATSLNPALWVTWTAYTLESLLTALTKAANIGPNYRPRSEYRCP